MTAPECRRIASADSAEAMPTCIERLATGWILATDLCPTCVQAFMAALDGITEPLKWHQAYTARAAMK